MPFEIRHCDFGHPVDSIPFPTEELLLSSLFGATNEEDLVRSCLAPSYAFGFECKNLFAFLQLLETVLFAIATGRVVLRGAAGSSSMDL